MSKILFFGNFSNDTPSHPISLIILLSGVPNFLNISSNVSISFPQLSLINSFPVIILYITQPKDQISLKIARIANL